jgi:hypothetical protein
VRSELRLVAFLFPLAALAMPAPASAQAYPPPYPFPYVAESNLRVNVKPKEAAVYVDGFFAGKVEEFDGSLQRLHLLPGEHEIVVYLEGYRSLKQHLYLGPNATRTMTGALEKLGPGEAQEPEPRPADIDRERPEPPDEATRTPSTRQATPPRPPMPPREPAQPREPGTQPLPPSGPRTQPAEPSRFASLSIRIRPGGGEILIDGERWEGPDNDERLIVQVPEGHHVIEVQRDGYERFTTEIDVRRGETTPVSISLQRR